MNKRLADSVAKILYEDTKTKLTKDNIKDSTARAAASILEAPIVSKKLDQSGPQKSAAEILFESIREKSQSQDSAARVAAQILKTSPATTQMIAESGSTISDALNFEPKIKTKDESIFYNKKRKQISEEVKHEIEALESKFETLETTLAEDLRKYKQNITEAVSTTKTNYAGTDSGGGEVRLLAMDDVETKMMNKQARVSYLANNVSLTYDTNDKLFHFRYAYNQNLLQSSNVIFNNIDTTGNINVGGTAFVTTLTASKPVFTDANKTLTSSGTMPTNQGGTGLTSFTANGIVYASSTSALATGSTLQFDGTNFGVGLTPVTNNGVLQLGSYAAIKSLVESATITGAAPAATTQFDLMTQAVQYYTSNATTNFTLNIRGNGSTSLNTVMQVGQSASIALLVTNGSPAYYMSAINIDGTASGVTVKYINGTSLSSGNANSIDIYNITVIKTASATYTVLVVQTKFA